MYYRNAKLAVLGVLCHKTLLSLHVVLDRLLAPPLFEVALSIVMAAWGCESKIETIGIQMESNSTCMACTVCATFKVPLACCDCFLVFGFLQGQTMRLIINANITKINVRIRWNCCVFRELHCTCENKNCGNLSVTSLETRHAMYSQRLNRENSVEPAFSQFH